MAVKHPARRWSKPALPGVSVVALSLLAIVAFASSAKVGGSAAVESPWLVVAFMAPLIALIILIAAAGTVGTAYAAVGSSKRKLLLVTLACALFAAPLVAIAVNHWRPSHNEYWCYQLNLHDARFPCKRGHASGGSVQGRDRRPFTIDSSATLVAAAGSLIALVFLVGGAVFLIRRRSSSVLDEPPVDEALVLALDESLDDLRAEGDVRRAVIACYARMEQALTDAGMGRRPAETPLEYLGRVLVSVAPQPGRSLTQLFERAAFSAEMMGVQERERAIAALEALRKEAAIALNRGGLATAAPHAVRSATLPLLPAATTPRQA